MRKTLLATVLGMSCLFAAEETKQKVQVSKTEHLDFASGGVLQLKNSTGELTVEAWDQPGVEITTIKSTKEAYASGDREKATRELDRVNVKGERQGQDLVITTDFPRHRFFPPPTSLGAAVDFDLEYDIKVPRDARLVVDHNIGEIHVEQLTGDVQVHARQGEITLHLAADRQYAIDAKSDIGDVISDFPGTEKRKVLVGHQFADSPPASAQKLHLRTGYGDIILLEIRKPSAPAPAAQ